MPSRLLWCCESFEVVSSRALRTDGKAPFPLGNTRPGCEEGECFGFDLNVERFEHLGYDLGDGDKDKRKGGGDEE